MNSKMINKSELIDIFNHSDAYKIPYINDTLSIGQLTNLNKDNVEYS
jgi:hypothetical protein